MILHEKSLEVLKSLNAAQIFLDILGGAQPPFFLEDLFEAPSEYFLEEEAEEYTQGKLIPIFDDGGPSSATFYDSANKQFVEMCMEDPDDPTHFQNWQQVLASMLNTIADHTVDLDKISDWSVEQPEVRQFAQTIGFQHYDAFANFRASNSGAQYPESSQRLKQFLGSI